MRVWHIAICFRNPGSSELKKEDGFRASTTPKPRSWFELEFGQIMAPMLSADDGYPTELNLDLEPTKTPPDKCGTDGGSKIPD
jgi:hypothetical protein